jgi:hypothetical protein
MLAVSNGKPAPFQANFYPTVKKKKSVLEHQSHKFFIKFKQLEDIKS